VTGFTYNFTNTATNYQNGIDWHLDWGASQFLSKQVQVGLVGYFYDQLTPDRGCLPVLCPLESGVIGVGPQLGYLFPVGNMQVGDALPGELLTAAFCDNRHIDRSGIRYSELPAEGRERLEALLATYTGRVRPGHAEIRYSEVKRYLNETIFAWIGQCDATSPFYYRILSPVILVEFDHMPGIGDWIWPSFSRSFSGVCQQSALGRQTARRANGRIRVVLGSIAHYPIRAGRRRKTDKDRCPKKGKRGMGRTQCRRG
jgi:hypothetical protein